MNGFLLIVALIMLIGVATLSRHGGVNSTAKIVLCVVFVVCASAALGLAYFAFAYENKGAGVVMFAAVPFAVIAWIAYVFLKGDDTQTSYTDLSFDTSTTYTVEKLDDMRADFDEVIAYNTAQLKRFWLSPFKRKQYRDEIRHAQFMLRYIEEQRRQLQRPRVNSSAAPEGVDRRSY